jgi:hypothetical protein
MNTQVATDSRGLLAVARRLSASLGAGAAAGLVVGGLGGRIAMFVLRLTSHPGLHGRLTDDGFTIGIVSTSTLFLLVLTTILGAMGGLAYLLVRSWLPKRQRPWLFGLLTGLIGGANILRPGGIDFTVLEPLSLAVALFILIPAIGGVLTSLLAERFLSADSPFARSWAALALLVFLLPIGLLGGPFGLAAMVAIAALILATHIGPNVVRLWTSSPATWLGRAALAAIGTLAFVELAGDVSTIL